MNETAPARIPAAQPAPNPKDKYLQPLNRRRDTSTKTARQGAKKKTHGRGDPGRTTRTRRGEVRKIKCKEKNVRDDAQSGRETAFPARL